MKLTIAAILVILVGIGIAGCVSLTPGLPPLAASINPNSGTVPFDVTVTVTDLGSGTTYTFSASDGAKIVSDKPVAQMKVTSMDWSVTVSAVTSSGRREAVTVAPAEIKKNLPPRPYNLGLPGDIGWHQKVELNFAYHEHAGCHPGDTIRYGIKDPEGLPLQYKVWIVSPTGVEDVYQVNGGETVRVTGQWSSNPVFVWFNGWTGISPPIPLAVAPSAISPSQTPSKVVKVVRVQVNDGYNQPTFEYRVQATNSTCGNS